MKNNPARRSIITITVFIIGIIAIASLLLISIVQKYSLIFIGVLAVVLICLIFLLTSTLSSRKKIIEQNLERAKSPYGNVDKKEIYSIFDMIDKEEKRRGRAMVYAAPEPVKTEEQKTSAEIKPESSSDTAASSADEDEEKLPIIFPDKDDFEDDKKAAPPEEKSEPVTESESKPAEEEGSSSSNEIADLVAAASLGAAAGEIAQDPEEITAEPDGHSAKGKVGKGGKNMDNRPKKRPPVYYDQYGRPIAAPPARQAPAQPVGYDPYGRPIYAQRPPQQRKPRPIGFDQNGMPIYPPQQRKPRPIGFDQNGRPIYPPQQAGARQRPAGARPPQQGQQRRRPAAPAAVAAAPVLPADQPAAVPVTPQIPTEPMAASAADALAALEANTAVNAAYYDEDYIPVVVHVEDDYNYSDDRYTPRVRAGISQDSPLTQTPSVNVNEYNSSGADTYRPDYASENIPVVVPMFEDMEVDYSSPRGFTPMSDPFAQKSYAPPVYTPEPVRTETPLATAPIYRDPTLANPEYNAKSAADYTRDDDEERFVYVPHFDDDDPIPEPVPDEPYIPHWKLAKMRRRNVRRRSRRGMLFKLKAEKFVDYTSSLNA